MKLRTKYKLQKYLRNSLLIILIALIINLGLTHYFYQKYTREVNNFVALVLTELQDEYPNLSANDIIKKLNSNEYPQDLSIFNKYGLDTHNNTFFKNWSNILKVNYLVSSAFIFIICLTYIILYLIESKKKNLEIEKIIQTLKKVNAKDYDLELEMEEEGNFAVLKDEIYKHTKILKESYENTYQDKITLKNTLADISHQIKTPLTSISILVDNLLTENVEKETQQEFLKDIRMQIDNINFLVLSLLKLSKFEANMIEFKKEVIDVEDMLNQVLKNLEPLITSKNINIHLNKEDNVSFVGDLNWEMEALSNIIKNSLEHTDNNKNIYLTYQNMPIYTKIIIEDEGCGIAPKDIAKIFNRFYNETESEYNFGIGLSLAKEIINKDNGKIVIKSSVGKGTKFIIKYFH